MTTIELRPKSGGGQVGLRVWPDYDQILTRQRRKSVALMSQIPVGVDCNSVNIGRNSVGVSHNLVGVNLNPIGNRPWSDRTLSPVGLRSVAGQIAAAIRPTLVAIR